MITLKPADNYSIDNTLILIWNFDCCLATVLLWQLLFIRSFHAYCWYCFHFLIKPKRMLLRINQNKTELKITNLLFIQIIWYFNSNRVIRILILVIFSTIKSEKMKKKLRINMMKNRRRQNREVFNSNLDICSIDGVCKVYTVNSTQQMYSITYVCICVFILTS